jgi:quercetin dioxygenase-like cupin family protein
MLNETKYRDPAVKTIERLAASLHSGGKEGILCSRDPKVIAAGNDLENLIPADFEGVKRFFLPFAPVMPKSNTGRYSAYYALLPPNTAIPKHSLESEKYALKVVLSGAIGFNGHWLTTGDWLWIPAGESYEFTSGDFGALLLTTLPYCEDDERSSDRHKQIAEAEAAVNSQVGNRATTCNHPVSKSAMKKLRNIGADQIPEHVDGAVHWFLPFAPRMPANEESEGRYFAWIAVLDPNTVIPNHSHAMEKLGDMKVVLSGSIMHDDEELTAGDWLWIPAGEKYNFKVGNKGATIVAMWPFN